MHYRLEQLLNYFFKNESIKDFENVLSLNSGITLQKFFQKNFFIGVFVSIATTSYFLVLTKAKILYIAFVGFTAFFIPFALSYFFQLYVFERNKRRKEEFIPDILLQASLFPRGAPFVKIIKYIAENNFGLLSKDFEKAFFEIKKGASVQEALENLKKRNKSRVIDRTINLLIQGYNSGANMSQTFRETAEDILETNSVLRERNATLIIEKYTLLFAGGLIIPMILGLLVRMVSGINFATIEGFEFGLSVTARKTLLETALLANQIYILEYALLASVFIANQENNLKKSFLYALFLVPASFMAYTLCKGFL